MPRDLKNKLLQFEAVPPPGAWEKIAVRLDEEFISSDGSLALKLENTVFAPPAMVWDKIEAELDETRVTAPVRAVPMYRRIAVAAAVIGVLVLGGIYFLRDNTPAQQEIVKEDVVYPGSNEITREEDITSPATHPGRVAGSLYAQSQTTRPPLQRRGLAGARNNSSVQQIAQLASYDMDIDDPKPVQMVSAMEPVQVEAPPIRDARGNVIMDLSVISKPNEPYITVTSPDGSQTKISRKFLSCLSYLNGNYANSEINYEGQQWKSRFAEWRNKISEAGFVPGASNFFDIFELQELIRD